MTFILKPCGSQPCDPCCQTCAQFASSLLSGDPWVEVASWITDPAGSITTAYDGFGCSDPNTWVVRVSSLSGTIDMSAFTMLSDPCIVAQGPGFTACVDADDLSALSVVLSGTDLQWSISGDILLTGFSSLDSRVSAFLTGVYGGSMRAILASMNLSDAGVLSSEVKVYECDGP
jgi:hypothetical protein